MVGVATGAVVVTTLAWTLLRRRPFRVAIEGDSMAPTLLPGDWALAAPMSRFARGDVVVVEHPDRPGYEMVKRLAAMPGDRVDSDRVLAADEHWVLGDHEARSTDSRGFGPVRPEHLVARVVLVYWPLERRRLVRRPNPGPGRMLRR